MTASATTLNQGFAEGDGTNYEQLTIAGTPTLGDQLVFHFFVNTNVSGAGGNGTSGFADWIILLSAASATAYAQQIVLDDGSHDPLTTANAKQTAGGYDLAVPFGTSIAAYLYQVEAVAENQERGAAFDVSITAQLDGIDAENANGTILGSATFDDTGNATLDITATPEPSSVVLMGTGLAGIAGFIGRRRKNAVAA